MTTATLKRALGDSVMALVSERRRLEDEILDLERQMTNTDISDEQVRALKRNVEALEAEAARKRELLARAEAQTRTLANDRAAAREAEHQAAIEATKRSLESECAAYMSDYAQLVRSLRTLTTTIPALEARMREIAVLSRSLSANGKAPIICDTTSFEKRLAWLVMHFLKRMPGRQHRFGTFVFEAYADAEHPVGLDPVEIEKTRLTNHVLPLTQAEG